MTNRDPSKLTVLVMTGVTAMARNSAVAIEKSGDNGFLARVVGPELAAADITTISNEIPFVPGCVANDSPNNLVLCSKPEYWENLALSGVDAVGLSGNHLLDFGRKASLGSLAFYEEKKVPVYGGGANEKAAAEPLVLEHNGNRLGFLGANQYGPPVAWAGPDKPGSARFDLPTMQADIQALKPQVDVVFAEVQHLETNYKGEYVNVPNDQAEIDFRGLSDAGADVVTGVMAHAPQAVEIRDGRADPVRAGQPLLRPDVELAHAHRPGPAAHDLRRQADQHRAAGDGDRQELPAALGDAGGTEAGAPERVRREPVVTFRF